MNASKARLCLVSGVLLLLCMAAVHWLLPGRVPDFIQGLMTGVGTGLLVAGLIGRHLPDPADASTPALRRRYMREFAPAMAGYTVTILGSIWLLKHHVDDPALRVLVALSPIPFVGLAMRAMLRHIRDTDEMQRRIEVESISLATALVSLGYFAAGLLQAAKVIDVPSAMAMIWVFPLLCFVYGLAKVVIARRYA
ncbi:MAG TPA: hypothetical protein VFE72_05040 [Lysobacter sp.]|nr:hypothetical protein [Lysobacter sp.]